MSDVVERVAKAIYDAADPTSGDCVAEALMHSPFVGDGDRNHIEDVMAICRSAARAAIEAMKVPDWPMKVAGRDSMCDTLYDGASVGDAESAWTAMITEALR
jgi:hypothetical protein